MWGGFGGFDHIPPPPSVLDDGDAELNSFDKLDRRRFHAGGP